MKTHAIQIYMLAVASVGLLLASCGKKQSAAPSVPPIDVSAVTTDSVVLYNTYPGLLQAVSKADVVGEVSGRLLAKHYKSGDFVRKGQKLFTIESTRYRDAVQEAQGALASAQSQEKFYAQQKVAMERAYAGNAVSRMELLQAESNLDNARASIRQAQARLNDARINLAKCTVVAPISGYISEEAVTVGNYVNGEAQPQKLATIVDNSRLKAVFSIEDSEYQTLLASDTTGDARRLLKCMPLQFNRQLPHSYTADLTYQAPSVNPATGSLELTGIVINQDNELKDGMYVTILLPYGVSRKALLVKDASISSDQLGKYLYTVNDSDKVVYTPIEVGQLYHDSLRVVTKGVRDGQLYVTKAMLNVRNGMQIKPVRH